MISMAAFLREKKYVVLHFFFIFFLILLSLLFSLATTHIAPYPYEWGLNPKPLVFNARDFTIIEGILMIF